MAIGYEFQLFFCQHSDKKSSSTNTATSFTFCSFDGPDQLISQPQGLPETLGYRLLFVDQSGNMLLVAASNLTFDDIEKQRKYETISFEEVQGGAVSPKGETLPGRVKLAWLGTITPLGDNLQSCCNF